MILSAFILFLSTPISAMSSELFYTTLSQFCEVHSALNPLQKEDLSLLKSFLNTEGLGIHSEANFQGILEHALEKDDLLVARLLWALQVDFHLENESEDENALLLACRYESPQCAHFLWPYVKSNEQHPFADWVLDTSLEIALYNNDYPLIEVLGPLAEAHQLTQLLYKNKRLDQPELQAFLQSQVQIQLNAQWSQALKKGLRHDESHFRLNSPDLYDQYCKQLQMPIWARLMHYNTQELSVFSLLNADQDSLISDSPPNPYRETALIHESYALDESSEVLLLTPQYFQFWTQELASDNSDEAKRELAKLCELEQEWQPLHDHFSDLVSRFRLAEDNPEAIEAFATHLKTFNAPRLSLFFLLWGEHRAFTVARDAALYAPILEICKMDTINGSMLCANLDYYSFNPRVACLAQALHQHGKMPADVMLMIHHRFEDLMSAPGNRTMTNPIYQKHFLDSYSYFKLQAERQVLNEITLSSMPSNRLESPLNKDVLRL